MVLSFLLSNASNDKDVRAPGHEVFALAALLSR